MKSLSLQQLVDWLSAQDPYTAFDLGNPSQCLMTQFVRGTVDPDCRETNLSNRHWTGHTGIRGTFSFRPWDVLGGLEAEAPMQRINFGHALARARSLLPSPVPA